MKPIRLIPLFLILVVNSLFARYLYNIYPNSAGVVKYQIYTASDNKLVKSKDITENTDIAKINIGASSDEDLNINVNIGSKYLLDKSTILLLDSNDHQITYKKFSDKTSHMNFVLSKQYIKNGTNNYKFIYAGIHINNNTKYYYAFHFKTIQITKSFTEPVITNIRCGSSSYKNEAKGFVGDEFAYVAQLSEGLPNGYKVYIAFMGVNDNGSNSNYYAQYYLMSKYNDTTYTYKKVIQKAGSNRRYKIVIKNENGSIVDTREGTYVVNINNPIKINSFSITKQNEDDNFEYFTMRATLSQKPKVVKIETDAKKTHYFYKNGVLQAKPTFVDSVSPSYDKKEWTIKFHIARQSNSQNKWFKLIVQDYRAKSANDLVDYQTRSFTVDKKKIIYLNITPDALSKKIPTSFSFDIKTDSYTNGLKVKTTKGESATVFRGKGGFPDGNINISVIDNNTWKVTYDVSSLSSATATSNDIDLTFYSLDSNGKILAQKTITVKAYKKTKVDLQTVLNFLDKSSVLNKLDLGTPSNINTHLSRAEASTILYEFLKLKNTNFKLPYDVEFYTNPFADVDKNTEYYKAVMTLVNYKGSDDITVLAKKYGVFNPLENVTRFQFVKMIVEGLNLTKSKDFSNIQKFSDYSQLANDAKTYFATAVKEDIIQGDNNKLYPYNKLTVFQALTILQRVLDKNFSINKSHFEQPVSGSKKIGNPLGFILEDQDYDPTVTPVKIKNITTQKDESCTKLTAVVTLDAKAKGRDYYVWSANFGYFKLLPQSKNYKEVLFCPSTRKPNVNYKIHLLAGDRYMNFSEFDKQLNRDNYSYVKNISDTNSNELKFNISLAPKNNVLKENSLFVISKSGGLYKDNLNIGLEKVAVVLEANGKTYSVDNVKWDDNSIYFIVPSIKELYGKNISINVDLGTNKNYKSFSYPVKYLPQYVIQGKVEQDKNGNLPKDIAINGEKVSLSSNEAFNFTPKTVGNYKIEINKNYPSKTVSISNENPTRYIYLNYINLDYDNDGVENSKDAFPYDPAISIDSDKDGYPDKYNPGYTSASVPLDKYPNDPSKWEETCDQVKTHAYNPNTGDEKDFATPCDVPEGWIVGKAPDSDGDGVNDIKDTDDDNDGISDKDEVKWGFDPLDPSDGGSADADGDGVSNADEIKAGSDPLDPNDTKKPKKFVPIMMDDMTIMVPLVNSHKPSQSRP